MLEKKLFLYSLNINEKQFDAFELLVQKPAKDIRLLMIENAADIIPGSAGWLSGIRNEWSARGYHVETLDLRQHLERNAGTQRRNFEEADVVWVGGGHTYYLRWILAASGSDLLIKEHVSKGKTYAGWSAGAVVAGPSIRFFGNMGDDPADAPEEIDEGLDLIDVCIIPHINNEDFAMGAAKTNALLIEAGEETLPMTDGEVLIVNGRHREVL